MNNTENQKQFKIGKDIIYLTVLSVLSGLVGVFLAYFFFIENRINQIEIQQAQTPPVVVVDFYKIASSYSTEYSEKEVESLMVKVNDAIYKLKESGYIVLDASHLISYPEDVSFPYQHVIAENENE